MAVLDVHKELNEDTRGESSLSAFVGSLRQLTTSTQSLAMIL